MAISELPSSSPAGYHPFRVGKLEFLALSDGFLPSEVAMLAPEVPLPELVDYLETRGHETARRHTQLSCLVSRDPLSQRVILVDGGIGQLPGRGGMPVATAGQLASNLQAAGVSPEAVDTVLVSHLHPDHIGGLFDSDDQPVYPNATFFVAQDEAQFWRQEAPDLSGILAPPPFREQVIRVAQHFLELVDGRLRTFAAGDAVLDCVKAISLAGHTPHQVGFLFESDGDALLYIADAMGHPLVSVERPGWRFTLDAEPATAIDTRKRLVAELRESRRRFFTPHFPWPNVGRIGTLEGHPLWVSEPYAWVRPALA